MSIIQRVPGIRLMDLTGMASQLKSKTFDAALAGATLTTLVSECVGSLPVFGDEFSDDYLKSDFTSVIGADLPWRSIEFFLLDEHCNELTNLSGPDYGVNYQQGFLTILAGFSFTQNLYKGYKVEWKKILDIFGPGTYKIMTRYTEEGEVILEQCSCKYDLCQYTEARADETVRIETTQNGKIINQGLNYLGANWKEQIRIKGFFGNKQRRLEQDNYLDKNRNTTQIQDSIIHEFTLEPYFWADCLREEIDSILLANEILISDYNTQNTDDLKEISVIPTSIDTEYFGKSKKAADELKFEERNKGRVKRNVK